MLKEGKKIACGVSEKIQDFGGVSESGCKTRCNADENCTYLWYRSQIQKCMLYSSCDTLADYALSAGKLFKKKKVEIQSLLKRLSNIQLKKYISISLAIVCFNHLLICSLQKYEFIAYSTVLYLLITLKACS